jgi:lipoprotein-anchoring transpeptidase ErfK/SrfK
MRKDATWLRVPGLVLGLLLMSASALPEPGTRPSAAGPATRAATTRKAANSVEDKLAWQIALERECFSPGLLDGKPGPKTKLAMMYWQKAHGLRETGSLDDATREKLRVEAALTDYEVQAQDLEDITPYTDDWIVRSEQKKTGYFSVLDGLAERFHTSQAFLKAQNPKVDFGAVVEGTRLRVPAVNSDAAPKANWVEVDLPRKVIFAKDAAGNVVGLFHCSIAAKVEKRPNGETKVVVIAPNPDYTWDPQYWPEVKGIDRKLMIAPGPRNPVGACWIGLGLPGYGMHGTPWPELIGKTGSHGCFRMTNWDAKRLAKMITVGARVAFIGEIDVNATQPAQ